MIFRFRSLFASLFAAAYSQVEAAAADAPLHTAFSAHFDIFVYGGLRLYILFSFRWVFFRFPSFFIDALILWPRLKE